MKRKPVWICLLGVGTTMALAFHIQSIDWLGSNRVRVAWGSASGAVYGVERAFELRQPFAGVASNLPAAPPLNVFTDTAPAEARAAFYRVRARWPEH